MSPRTALIASFLTVVLTAPALGQAPIRLEGGASVWQAQYDSRWRGYDREQRARQRYRDYQRRRAYERQQAYDRWRAYEARRRAYEDRRRGFDSFWGRDSDRYWGARPDRRWDPRRQRRSAPEQLTGGPKPEITPQAPEIVAFANNQPTGTVIIDHEGRKLYYTLSKTQAYAYPVAVGREGFGWTGTETISRVANWPSWHPPAEMRQRQPELPKVMTGGINNPLGAKALYLGDTLYRIHGSNDDKSIGQAASSGCFRMTNQHVLHLAGLVEVGTTVKVVRRWPSGGMANAEEGAQTATASGESGGGVR